MIYKVYRISLHIAVFVQRLAVCDAAVYDVSVDKAFDLRIIVTGSHVIQSVCACFYAISSIIQEIKFSPLLLLFFHKNSYLRSINNNYVMIARTNL